MCSTRSVCIVGIDSSHYFGSDSSGFQSVSAAFGSEGCGSGDCSSEDAADWMSFLNCTKIIVMLSQPSPPAVDGAKHLSRTFSHTADSLFSYMNNTP